MKNSRQNVILQNKNEILQVLEWVCEFEDAWKQVASSIGIHLMGTPRLGHKWVLKVDTTRLVRKVN